MDTITILDNICSRINAICSSLIVIEASNLIVQPQIRDLLRLYIEVLMDSGFKLKEIHNEMCEEEFRTEL